MSVIFIVPCNSELFFCNNKHDAYLPRFVGLAAMVMPGWHSLPQGALPLPPHK
jgi:hypothetical protein